MAFKSACQMHKNQKSETLPWKYYHCVSAGLPVRGSFYQMKKQNVGHQKKITKND